MAQVNFRNPEDLPPIRKTSQGAPTSDSFPGLWTGCPPGFGEYFLSQGGTFLLPACPQKLEGLTRIPGPRGFYALMDQAVGRSLVSALISSYLDSFCCCLIFPRSLKYLGHRRSNFWDSVHYAFEFRWQVVTTSFISLLQHPSAPKRPALAEREFTICSSLSALVCFKNCYNF